MHKELELWAFIADRLARDEPVMLLVVAESSGSSPGRQGYKMAVGIDGELAGSIGGGVMEVKLVEESRRVLRDGASEGRGDAESSRMSEQVHRKNADHASGMICSGKQTVILRLIGDDETSSVVAIIAALENRTPIDLRISSSEFIVIQDKNPPATAGGTDFVVNETDFSYRERLGFNNELFIIGGGHCALALSELMSKMDFRITLFDDRPELNTIAKNSFAHEIKIIEGYERIAEHIPSGENVYVVVMTLGYKTDGAVIRSLIDHNFKYFGVLGSNAKMSTMLKELIKEGLPAEKLERIRTPVGISINSRTPDEIAVSIAAEIISVKNSA